MNMTSTVKSIECLVIGEKAPIGVGKTTWCHRMTTGEFIDENHMCIEQENFELELPSNMGDFLFHMHEVSVDLIEEYVKNKNYKRPDIIIYFLDPIIGINHVVIHFLNTCQKIKNIFVRNKYFILFLHLSS